MGYFLSVTFFQQFSLINPFCKTRGLGEGVPSLPLAPVTLNFHSANLLTIFPVLYALPQSHRLSFVQQPPP